MDHSGGSDRSPWGSPLLIETHTALIILYGDQAHKVRKPIGQRDGGRGMEPTNCMDRYGQPAGPAAESCVFHWLTTKCHASGVDPGIGQPP